MAPGNLGALYGTSLMLATCQHCAVAPRSAVSALFFINGFVFANWLTRIPAVASSLQLSSVQVGAALLGMGVGALIAFPLTGGLIERFGSARVTVAFGALFTLTLPLLALAPRLGWLVAALLLFGFGNGGMDVAMNAQGVEAQRRLRRTIMSSLHGFFSLGGLVGAATGGAFAASNATLSLHFLLVMAMMLSLLTLAARHLVADERRAAAARALTFALPARELWPLGLVAVCAGISEGAIGDWSALYLSGILGASPGVAALGYAALSTTMLLGRFGGDSLVNRFGAAPLVRSGAVIAAAGLALGLAVPSPVAALLGFAAAGIGLSVIIPLVYAAAGSHPRIPRGRAVAGVATIGYSGFLLGPPLLGWVADLISLRAALLHVVLLIAAIVVLPRVEEARG